MSKKSEFAEFQIYLSNAISAIQNGKPAWQRTGSPQNPFVDIRDALRKAEDLAAPFSRANVTILMTKGTHYVLLEEETLRYRPERPSDQKGGSFSLIIKPLPCGYDPSLESACVSQSNKVRLAIKIGAYFQLHLPASTIIEQVEFDFSDSLLPWGSPCQKRRSTTCSIIQAQDDTFAVSSQDSDCTCRDPWIQASQCNYHHPVSFFNLPLPKATEDQLKLTLKEVKLTKVFQPFHSLIGFEPRAPPTLLLTHSTFESLSICGPIIRPTGVPPQNPSDEVANAFFKPMAVISSFQQTSSITIASCSFNKIGLTHEYGDFESLQVSLFHNTQYNQTAAILAVEDVSTFIQVTDSRFNRIKLLFNPLTPMDTSRSSLFEGGLLLQRRGLLDQALFAIKRHSRGLMMAGNTFTHNSGIRGIVVVEIASAYQKGAVIFNNTFSHSSSLMRAGVLNLRSLYDSQEAQSCSGYHIQGNSFTRTIVLNSHASVIYMTCITSNSDQINEVAEVSGFQYFREPNLRIHQQPIANKQTYRIGDTSIQVNFQHTVLKSNQMAQNLRFKRSGGLIVSLYMNSFLIDGLVLLRNGDLNLMEFSDSTSQFWSKYGGLHAKYHTSALFKDFMEDYSWRFGDKMLILGSCRSVDLQNIEAYDSWYWESKDESSGHFISTHNSPGAVSNLRVQSFFQGTHEALFGFMLSDHKPLSQEFRISAEQFALPQIEGNLLALNTCTFRNIFIANINLSDSIIRGRSEQECIIENLNIHNVRSKNLVKENGLKSLIIQGGHVSLYQFFNIYFAANRGQYSNLVFSNQELKLNRLVQCTVDYDMFGFQSFTNVTLDTPSGNSTCSNDILISNLFARFQLDSFTIQGFKSDMSNIVRLMGGLVTISNSLFINNYAPRGIAIKFVGNGEVIIQDSQFIGNKGQASTVILMSEQAKLTARRSLFQNNTAVSSGAVIGFSGSGTFLFEDCEFIGNEAPSGSILNGLSSDKNVQQVFSNCSFSDNIGSNTFYSFLMNVSLIGTQYYRNIDSQGSSSPLYLSGSSYKVKTSKFSNKGHQHCIEGSFKRGGFIFDASDNTIEIEDTVFEQVCSREGGAIYLSGDSSFSIQRSSFKRCLSKEGGGAIQAKSFGDLRILESQFMENHGSFGADIAASDSPHSALIQKCQFRNSRSNSIAITNAGVKIIQSSFNEIVLSPHESIIQAYHAKQISISKSNFTSLEVGSVASIFIRDRETTSSATIDGCQFRNIKAWRDGGSVRAYQPGALTISNNQFKDSNIYQDGGKGGAIHYHSISKHQVEFKGNQFVGCSADYGGAIYWSYQEPLIRKNTFQGNRASYYGPKVASYGREIVFISEEQGKALFEGSPHNVETQSLSKQKLSKFRSGAQLPVLYGAVIDKYNQVVTDTRGDIIYTTARAKDIQEGKKNHYPPLLRDSNPNSWTNGVIMIQHLNLIGEPGRPYEITLNSPIISTSLPAVQSLLEQRGISKIQLFIDVDLRLCKPGEEFLPEGQCKQCPPYFYLLQAPREPTPCSPCLQNAVCFGGDKIGPKPGYWRSNALSTTFYSCFHSGACLGTSNDEQYNPHGQCAQGYQGILCGVCSENYTSNSQHRCSKCPEAFTNIIILFCLSALSIFILVLIIKWVLIDCRCSLRSSVRRKSLFTVYFKILVNHVQVLMLISEFDLDWPREVFLPLTTGQIFPRCVSDNC